MKKMKLSTKSNTQASYGASELARILHDRLEVGPTLHRLRQAQVWIVLAIASIVLMWGGMKLGGRFGLLVGFLLALSFNALIYFYDQWRLTPRFDGPEFEGQDPWGCLAITRRLVQRLRQNSPFPTPSLRKFDCDTPMVLASGLTSRNLRLFISTGALKRLSPEELEAAIAFQLIRFHTNQLRLATAAAAFADMMLTLAAALDAGFFLRFFLGREPRRNCPGPVTWCFRPFVIMFLRLVMHRKSFSAVDQLTAETFGCTQTLARTLVKLDAYNKTLPANVNYAEASLCIVDPLAGLPESSWASIQPPIESRVKALVGHFPL